MSRVKRVIDKLLRENGNYPVFSIGKDMTNKKIKEITALRDKSKARKESGLYIVEGIRMYKEVPKEDLAECYMSARFAAENPDMSGKAEVIDDALFAKLSDTKTPQGVMCVCRQKNYGVEDIISSSKGLYVLLEDIQDPGNLGTIFRTGEGAGVAGIIMTKGCVDIYNPKTIRSTMGSIYRVPFTYTDDIAAAIEKLGKAGVKTYAAHLKGEKYYSEIAYEGAAFLIGNEGNGLREETAALADEYIKIPMHGQVESLNAAVATSILMYEYSRQNP